MKKITLPKMSMPVVKPGGCCGTAASKKFVFGNQDAPEPCCSLGIPMGLWSPTVETTDISYQTPVFNLGDYIASDCSVTLEFGLFSNYPQCDIFFYVNNVSQPLQWEGNSSNPIVTLTGNDNFYFSFDCTFPDSQLSISCYNVTCNYSYNQVYNITLSYGTCCALIEPTLYEESFVPRNNSLESSVITFANLECPVTLCFKASPSNTDAAVKIVNLWSVISPNPIPVSNSVPLDGTSICKTFNNGDQFYFYIESDECNVFTIEAVNQTCDTNLGVIGVFGVLFDPTCSICPPWDLGNRHSFTQYVEHSWQNTNTNAVTIRLFCDNTIANFTNTVTAYESPTTDKNDAIASFLLMEFGATYGDIDVPINGLNYLIISSEVTDSDCSEVTIDFTNVTCFEPIGTINKFIVNKGAC